MINDIGGLPAHPLIVHIPVVFVPLATIGALLMVIRPSWRRMFEIPTAVLAASAAIATQLAIQSGESLEHRVEHSELIETHSRIAEQARPWIFLFAAVMVAVAVVDVLQRRRNAGDSTTGSELAAARSTPRSRAATAVVALTALGLVLGAGATVQVYRTGHSGAKATWHDTPDKSSDDRDSDGG